MADSHTGLKNVNYETIKLSGAINTFQIPTFEELYAPSMQSHPFYSYHDKPFSKERLMFSTLPLHIGPFQIEIPTEITNVLRCPIKMNNSREIVLPEELSFLKDFIMYCCIYETSFNKRFEELFCHITVHKKTVKQGETHRAVSYTHLTLPTNSRV